MKPMKYFQEIINLKEQKLTNKAIANKLSISLSSVEKALKLHRFLIEAKPALNDEQFKKLEALNYKALILAPVVSNEPILMEVLDNIDDKSSPERIQEVMELSLFKSQDIQRAYASINYNAIAIEKLQKAIEDTRQEIEEIRAEAYGKFNFILENKSLSEKVQKKILDAIGYDRKADIWVLVGFISKTHYFKFKKQGLIKEIAGGPIVVQDIDAFTKAVARSKTFTVTPGYYEDYIISKNSLLTFNNALSEELSKKVDGYLKDINELKKDIKVHQKDHQRLMKANIYDFETVLKARQELAKKDIESHDALSFKGMEWLVSQGYISGMEYTEGNMRFDVLGVDPKDGNIIILESKVTPSDYHSDKKKEKYKDYCHELYIVTDNFFVMSKAKEDGYGVIYLKDEARIIPGEKRTSCNLKAEDIAFKLYKKLYDRIYHL